MNITFGGCLVFLIVAVLALMAIVGGYNGVVDGIMYSRAGKIASNLALVAASFAAVSYGIALIFKGLQSHRKKWVGLTTSGALVILLAVAFFSTPRSHMTPKLYNQAAAVCSGGIIEEAAEFTPSAERHPTVLVDKDGNCYRSCEGLGESWGADALSELELVLCVDYVDEPQIDRCDYTDNYILRLYRQDLVGRLITAKTGEVVTDFTIEGHAPTCPQEIRTSSGERSSTDNGQLPSVPRIRDWLNAYFGVR